MNTDMCPACKAAWGEIESGCLERHNSEVLVLATKLAEAVGHHNPTLAQTGWFAEDAESVMNNLGYQDSWKVIFTMDTARGPDGYDPIIEINGRLFRCGEGPMSPYVPDEDEEETP